MTRQFRRFEILLPQQFNSGERVPEATFRETLQELKERFGGVSAETQDIEATASTTINRSPTTWSACTSTCPTRRRTCSFSAT